MKLTPAHRKKEFRLFVPLCCLFLMTGFTSGSEQKPDEKADSSASAPSDYSAPMERLNSGFVNILSGPIELVGQPREEIKRTDLIRGFLPGAIKGVAWFALREGVGLFEAFTFFAPWKPHLEPVDTDWLTA